MWSNELVGKMCSVIRELCGMKSEEPQELYDYLDKNYSWGNFDNIMKALPSQYVEACHFERLDKCSNEFCKHIALKYIIAETFEKKVKAEEHRELANWPLISGAELLNLLAKNC